MTTKELRTQLFKDMKDLRTRKIDVKKANVLVKNAAQIVYLKRLEIEEANLQLKVANSRPKNSSITVKPISL